MLIKQYDVTGLLCNYLKRYVLECPFVKVTVLEEEVIISLGRESCDQENTYQKFEQVEKYEFKTDIQRLEQLLMDNKHDPDLSCNKISEKELLLTRKREVILDNAEIGEHQAAEEFFDNFYEFMEYIKNTKRTVLSVSKQRYFVRELGTPGAIELADPIPVGRYNDVEAYVVFCSGVTYQNGVFAGTEMDKLFTVTREKIERLDKNSFEVFILKETEEFICYEILNKNL